MPLAYANTFCYTNCAREREYCLQLRRKKKDLIWSEYRIPYCNSCTAIGRQTFINMTILPRVSTYNGHLQGGVYQRKVELRLTVLEMCRYRTEIRELNYMVKVKVKFTL